MGGPRRARIPLTRQGIAIRQVAALPYRIEPDGSVRVLLITSRETQRWVLPKGNLIKGKARHEAAAQEAFEEAGVSGTASAKPLGRYRYAKRRKDGTTRDAAVTVFPLSVAVQARHWPERQERETRWFDPADAAAAIDEPDLAALIVGFRPPPE